MIPYLGPGMHFPHPENASKEPDGLLAFGGDLQSGRLQAAYRLGIFPFYGEDAPVILWWSPSKRGVLLPEALHISRRFRRQLKQQKFQVTLDQAFTQVIQGCAERVSTWITKEMEMAYISLHNEGVAHSIEVWRDSELIGGLYGVSIGCVFFGESMFSRRTNGSKIAFTYLATQLRQWGFALLDCQFSTDHLQSLGVVEIARQDFLYYLQRYIDQEPMNAWQKPIHSPLVNFTQ